MSETKRHPRNPRKPGRIPAMAAWRPVDGDPASPPTVTYRPAARVVPRDRRLEHKLVRHIAA